MSLDLAGLCRKTGGLAVASPSAEFLIRELLHAQHMWVSHWRINSRLGQKQSRRFLKCTDDHVLCKCYRNQPEGAVLDPVLTSKEGLVGNLKLKGNLGCSDHEMMEPGQGGELTAALCEQGMFLLPRSLVIFCGLTKP